MGNKVSKIRLKGASIDSVRQVLKVQMRQERGELDIKGRSLNLIHPSMQRSPCYNQMLTAQGRKAIRRMNAGGGLKHPHRSRKEQIHGSLRASCCLQGDRPGPNSLHIERTTVSASPPRTFCGKKNPVSLFSVFSFLWILSSLRAAKCHALFWTQSQEVEQDSGTWDDVPKAALQLCRALPGSLECCACCALASRVS